MTGTIALVLGRPPSPSSLVPEVVRLLRAAGAEVSATVTRDGATLPEAVLHADLRVLKDLPPAVLTALPAASGGRPSCDDPRAVLRCHDKAAVARTLAAAGVPVPRTTTVEAWGDVRRSVGPAGAVVKPRTGSRGRGVLVLHGPAPSSPPTPGPWIVQELIEGDGWDRKLYVIGRRVLGLLRPWPTPADHVGTPFTPTGDMAELAVSAAAAMELEICGVDVVASADRDVVVDVNPFPGFKGAPGAAPALAAHLLTRVPSQEVSRCA